MDDIKELAGVVAGSIGAALRQTYERHDGTWWLFTAGKPMRALAKDEIEWHMVRRHKPFIADGIDSSDPRWWDDPVISEDRPSWWPDDWVWPPEFSNDLFI